MPAVTLGLDVVVGIEQHRRRPRRRRVPRDHRRRTALADNPHVVKTGLRQQVCHRTRAAVNLVAPIWVGPHRFDADQLLEITPHRRQHLTDALNQLASRRRVA
ncbi:Uncharacterised protein [Mycobacterium tuberculosis]|nr:Uncharacterised protein [Mycobacterium tuberculosis]